MNDAEAKKLVDAMGWAAVWRRLDHSERMADTILQIADDPRRGEAAKILEIVARVRRAYKHGWSVPAGEMEQLRLLSDAADKKATGPLIEEAGKRRARWQPAADAANRQRHEEAEAQRAAWQSAADEIWTRRPELSKTAVAALVAEKQGGNADTIRRKLARPSRL